MDLTRYTSFETSVALREAGAPQDVPQFGAYMLTEHPEAGPHVVQYGANAGTWTVRTWRLDEILEALAEAGEGIRLSGCRDGWALCTDGDVLGSGSSPVGAAAACLLAVLRSRADMKRTNKEADNGL